MPPRSAPPAPGLPRSLADDLRARSEDDVVALLLARPELATPVPLDVTALAARASTRVSAARAMDRLRVPELEVLEVLAAVWTDEGAVPAARVASACSAPAPDVEPLLETLRALALVWGPREHLTPLRAAVEVLGATPAGLGPPLADALGGRPPSRIVALLEDLGLPPAGDPVTGLHAVAEMLGDRKTLDALLSRAPDGVRPLLERLAAGPPFGTVETADRQVRAADASTPVEWALAHGLLAPAGVSAVVLPREVALALRGGHVRDGLTLAPPALDLTERDPSRVDAQGAGAAAEAVRLVHEMLRAFESAPPAVLRAGGLGVRELRRLAVRLDVPEGDAAFLVELCRAAGLLADDGEADPSWVPTPAYDGWVSLGSGHRWALLAQAWLATSRVSALVGTRDELGQHRGPRTALSDGLDRTAAPDVRAAVLGELAALAPGTSATVASLTERIAWRLPRRSAASGGRLVAWTAAEAGQLGVTALGALTSAGRALLGEDEGVSDGMGDGDPAQEQARRDAAASAVESVMAPPVTQVLLQADLTAVAPGPLVPELAEAMALMADVDSRGGATVYRFSPDSLRRAMDAGRGARDVLAFLAEHSATPVPQALEYLVADAARRHGRVRVGVAGAYLRSDDAPSLAEVLADPRAAPLRLRSLAPTVAAAQAEPAQVIAVLRSMGLAPAIEGDDSELLLHAPERRRAPAQPAPRPVTGQPPRTSEDEARSLVVALRRADEESVGAAPSGSPGSGAAPAARDRSAPPLLSGGGPGPNPAEALALLRQAAAARSPVRLTVTDQAGRRRTTRVQPLRIEAGSVVVVDVASGAVSRVSAHRVVSVERSATS